MNGTARPFIDAVTTANLHVPHKLVSTDKQLIKIVKGTESVEIDKLLLAYISKIYCIVRVPKATF